MDKNGNFKYYSVNEHSKTYRLAKVDIFTSNIIKIETLILSVWYKKTENYYTLVSIDWIQLI